MEDTVNDQLEDVSDERTRAFFEHRAFFAHRRVIMAASIAAGVVRIDSSRHENPTEVARVSLAIADEILHQAEPQRGEEAHTPEPPLMAETIAG